MKPRLLPALALLLAGAAFAGDDKNLVASLPSLPGPAPTVPASRLEQVKDLVSKALVEEKLGNYPDALRFYTMALSASPGQPFIRDSLDRLSRSIHARGERNLDRSRAHHVQEALRRSEVTGFRQDEEEALSLEGYRLLGKGLALEAVDMFEQALAKSGKHASSLEGLEKARRKISFRLRRSRFESPQQYAAYQGMDRYLDANWLGAIEALERSIKMGPLTGELAAAHLPDYAAGARANLDRELWRGEREGVLAQARVDYEQGRWLEAEPLFKRILAADPSDEEALKLGTVVFQKCEEARAKEKEAARVKDLGETLEEARRLAKAGDSLGTLEASAHALDLDPQNAEALGYLKASQERLRKQGFVAPDVTVDNAAEEAYRRALRLYGNDEKEEALKAVDEALRADPEHAEAKALKERLTAKPTPEVSQP